MTAYKRTQRGTVIHRATCYHVRATTPDWAWALGRDVGELQDVAIRFGYSTCRHCNPLGEWT